MLPELEPDVPGLVPVPELLPFVVLAPAPCPFMRPVSVPVLMVLLPPEAPVPVVPEALFISVVLVSPEALPASLLLLQAIKSDNAAAVTKTCFMLCVLKCCKYDIARCLLQLFCHRLCKRKPVSVFGSFDTFIPQCAANCLMLGL